MSTSKFTRGSTAKRLLAAGLGVVVMALAVPTAASAQPSPTIPGLPGVPLPQIPGLTVPTPQAPETTPQPAPEPVKPAEPAPPVKTDTGWVALADDATHELTVWHDGKIVRKMPISMGSNEHPTPNGTYYTKEKYRDMYMDSSTYGVPIDSPGGYRTYVEYAIRMSWDGIFLHAAPWSLEQQGNTNVSHGCINVSTENGKWAYENFPEGTPIVVQGTIGGEYIQGS
ncbi:L,D-transpeptidase [Nocardia sp. 348MFTsu5.1]|uniref:L,D-transpeptidase n=1 Tax=Nocardia sp. 348MFTsu5.1 TaxID=1172185 RepID=UPI000371591D|nr:L,D-transpeptidase [Nocardia sp. 348MFTsu5.1]